jgi:hypothetical protein
VQYHKERVDYANTKKEWRAVKFMKYNMKIDRSLEVEQKRDEAKDWERLEKKFSLSKFINELPMCIIVTKRESYSNFDV